MDEFKLKVKKVRKICFILSLVVILFFTGFTVVKLVAVGAGVSGVVTPTEEIPPDPEGMNQVLYGFLNVFAVSAGFVGGFIFIVLGIIKILIGLAIIWLVFLIYYLVKRHKYRKQQDLNTSNSLKQ
jgi:TRAP-type C4-dicarboxylate transport system permease small subunit